ncbi:MAG: 4Fe-4S binding protein [Dialister invisus]
MDIDRKRRTWTIDPAACVQCGVCVEHCPKQCLSLNEAYTFTADGDSPEPVSFTCRNGKTFAGKACGET